MTNFPTGVEATSFAGTHRLLGDDGSGIKDYAPAILAAGIKPYLGLGTAASAHASDFATAAQGSKADGAALRAANLADLVNPVAALAILGGQPLPLSINVTSYGFNAYNTSATGSFNVTIGGNAGHAATSCSQLTAIGANAAAALTSGAGVTAIGYQALGAATIGGNNVAVGAYALASAVGVGLNTAIGAEAMRYANDAGLGSNGYNTALGYRALKGSTSPPNNTGQYNTAIGANALQAATAGSTNCALGYNALGSLNTGTSNVAIGYNAGSAGTAITSGGNNTFIGFGSGGNSASLTNATAIGNGASATGSNQIVLGNNAITAIYAAVTSLSAISDQRHKQDIDPLPFDPLVLLAALKPRQYRLKGDPTLRYGFIAQDLAAALPAPAAQSAKAENGQGLALIQQADDDQRSYRVNYAELIAPLVGAIQALIARLEALEARQPA